MTEGLAEKHCLAFLQLWAESLQEVLAQIAGAPCPAQIAALSETPTSATSPDSNAESNSNFLITASGALRGEMNIHFPAKTALAFGQCLLGEEQNATAELTPDHREAALELFRQIAGLAATKITASFGETQLRVEAVTAPTWSVAANAAISSAPDAKIPFRLEWQISSALTAALASAKDKPQEQNVSTAAAPSSRNGSGLATTVTNLNLFKDVELDVTMRFGGRRMLLREILELGPGSVIELDRQVQEPVDLLLDGKIIARGEVVVVEGNYGLRVLEVTSQ